MVDNIVEEREQSRQEWRAVSRIVAKALLLFILLNLGFALLDPLAALGQLSAYNVFFPGRLRLPYGDRRSAEYNLSLNNIPAMFHSHTVAGVFTEDSTRVLVVGDSSAWGWLLEPDETLTAHLNDDAAAAGRAIHFYNLGYPVLSVTKDLVLLEAAMQFEPDLIIWPVTLASLAPAQQLEHPLLRENPARVRSLIARYNLAQDPDDSRLHDPSFYDNSIAGRRRDLADLLRLQLLAPLWAATRIDQVWPETIELRQSDFEADLSWETYAEPVRLVDEDLSLDVLEAGVTLAGEVPVVIINEPIYVSSGENSDLRYNSFYPRWAYDQYRALLASAAVENGWHYFDYWDTIPPEAFTDTPVHLTATATEQLARRLWHDLETHHLLPQ